MFFTKIKNWLVSKLFSQQPKQTLHPENDFVITVHDSTISCSHPAYPKQTLSLNDLEEVIIESNAMGPVSIDLFWILLGKQNKCIIPVGAKNENLLMDYVLKLPGFQHDIFIKAMVCTDNATFSCWRRNNIPAPIVKESSDQKHQ